ncbi:unnamed protein product [Auanema sp. JU1783]|nr:unnamed protein product [Auanema sp. JU1783]
MEDTESVNPFKRKYPKQVFTAEQLEKRRQNAKLRRETNEKKYKCPSCDMHFLFPNVLNRHLKTHEKQRFKCEFCEELFDCHKLLRAHNKEKHPKLHQCSKCDYSSSVLSTVRKHFTAQHVNGVPCTVVGCSAIVAKNSLKAHLKKVHSDISNETELLRKKISVEVPCAHCDFKCAAQDEMDLHVEKSHIGFDCPIEGCSRKLYTSNLEEHLKHAHPEHNFEDESRTNVTGSSVSNCSSVLNGHDVSESICSENEDSDSDLDAIFKKTIDILAGTGEGESTFIRSALGEYICCACGKKFSRRRYLTKHLNRIHYDGKEKRTVKMYECKYPGCSKMFRAPCLAEDHMNIHLDLTPFQCESCNMSFKGRARFAVHLKKYHQSSIRDYTAIKNNLPQMKLSSLHGEPVSC